ncbi:MAG: ABC transporter substrate-binding protein, partial [Salinarimonas sp.]
MKRRFSTLALATALPLTMMAAVPALSADLRIGLSSEPSSMDPHFHNLGPNNALRQHIFQSLTYSDENMLIQPS